MVQQMRQCDNCKWFRGQIDRLQKIEVDALYARKREQEVQTLLSAITNIKEEFEKGSGCSSVVLSIINNALEYMESEEPRRFSLASLL